MRRQNPSGAAPWVALGAVGLVFFVVGKTGQLGPLQPIYNGLRGTAGAVTAPTPVPPIGSPLPPSQSGSNPYTFVPGWRYVAAAPGGGFVVVYNGTNRGTFSDQVTAQNYFNQIAANGG